MPRPATGPMKRILFLAAFSVVFLFTGASLASTRFDRLSCLSEGRIEAVRAEPSSGMTTAFEGCKAELASKMGSLGLSEQQTKAAFVAVLANAMAPYGPSRSITLKDLLADKMMDCDNYAILTGHFIRIFLGKQFPVRFSGFDGGAVGNHAQLFVGENGEQLLLDPTVGLVARIGFDDLLMGKPLQAKQIRIFRQHPDKTLDTFIDKVLDALTHGRYRPSDLLYYFASLDEYVRFSVDTDALWNTDVDALLLRFPTPGSRALHKRLSGHPGR